MLSDELPKLTEHPAESSTASTLAAAPVTIRLETAWRIASPENTHGSIQSIES
ncbi:hypothetical protein [Streptomyces sp. MAR4 CNX-425]|uniref:hypothetical protein n=1 Tax=Streptomyces sp. MAR4 CNX-425 TaxID=3406343 RepID=UPI003B502CE5